MKPGLLFVVITLILSSARIAQAQQSGLMGYESQESRLLNPDPMFSSHANFQSDYSAAAVRVLLVPEKETILSSSLAARIDSINASLGSRFVKGDVLIRFSCEEPMARKDMVQAELAGALETHEGKIRMQGLKQASDIEVALAASEVARLRAQLALTDIQIKHCQITAPWRGRVSKVFVSNYMSVAAGEPLLEIVKQGRLKIRLNVPSKKVGKLKTGDRFMVSIDETAKRYKAKIVAINSRIDSVSQTIELEGRMVEEYPGLLAGMSGVAIFPTDNAD